MFNPSLLNNFKVLPTSDQDVADIPQNHSISFPRPTIRSSTTGGAGEDEGSACSRRETAREEYDKIAPLYAQIYQSHAIDIAPFRELAGRLSPNSRIVFNQQHEHHDIACLA
jgi:hypothetical protein